MPKSNLVKAVEQITSKVKSIKLTEISALQTSNAQKIATELQLKAGALNQAVAQNLDKDLVLKAHEELVQAIDIAGLVGVISNDELTNYYKHLDDIWEEMEKL